MGKTAMNETDRLLSVGISLHGEGINDWALTVEQALQVIQYIRVSKGVCILGGDVLRLKGGRFQYTHDSWHSDRCGGEEFQDFADRSISESDYYIRNYVRRNPSGDFFFTLVLDIQRDAIS